MSSMESSQTSLLAAVQDNNLVLTRKILNRYGLISDSSWMDYKILIHAVKNRSLDIVKLLLQRGCRTRNKTKTNVYCTPLYYAVENNDIEIMKELLSKGASINDRDHNNDTALFLANAKRYFEAVDLLLSMYDTKNIIPTCRYECVNFCIACIRNNVQLIKIFISKGIEMNGSYLKIKEKVSSEALKVTPLHLAIQYQAVETVELLLQHGANPGFVTEDNPMSPFHFAFYIDLKISNASLQKSKSHKILDLLLNFYNSNDVKNPVDRRGLSHFHVACTRKTNKSSIIIKKFIKSGVNINAPISPSQGTFGGFTPLHLAVYFDCKETVKILLEHKANINVIVGKETPISMAVARKNMEMIKLLVRFNPNICIKDGNTNTILHNSFYEEHLNNPIVSALVAVHETNKENPVNKTMLSHFHIACTTNNLKAVENFLKSGVDVNMRMNSDAGKGGCYTALHFAVEFHKKKIVELLLKYGADVHATEFQGCTALSLACEQSSDGNADLVEGFFGTVMSKRMKLDYSDDIESYFANSNKLQIAKCLLDHNSDVNTRDKTGKPLLFHACETDTDKELANFLKLRSPSEGPAGEILTKLAGDIGNEILRNRRRIISMLIDYNVDVNIRDKNKRTFLHYTAEVANMDQEGILDNCELLLIRGLKVDTPNKCGKTALYLAAERGYSTLVELLLKFKADPNFCEPKKLMTPLHIAVSNCVAKETDIQGSHSKIINLLLAHGADINSKDSRGRTPIFETCSREVPRIAIRQLCKADSDVNICDKDGRTVIFEAVRIGNFSAAQCLLDVGADINIRDSKNFSVVKYFHKMLQAFAFEENIETFKVLEMHIEKLKLIKAPISDQSLRYCSKLRSTFKQVTIFPFMNPMFGDEDSSIDYYITEFKDELKRMKKIKISDHDTLYEILITDVRFLVKYAKNEILQDYLEFGRFRTTVPHYGYILNVKHKAILKRDRLFESARRALNSITNFCWPETCYLSIFIHLSDEELKSLIRTTEL